RRQAPDLRCLHRFGRYAPGSRMDGGHHHWPRIYGSRLAQYRVRGGLHHRRLRFGKNKNGFAGRRGRGTDCRLPQYFSQADCLCSAVAGRCQRANLRRAVFFPFLEPARQPHYPAPETAHDGSARKVRGCRPVLKFSFLRMTVEPCLRSPARRFLALLWVIRSFARTTWPRASRCVTASLSPCMFTEGFAAASELWKRAIRWAKAS